MLQIISGLQERSCLHRHFKKLFTLPDRTRISLSMMTMKDTPISSGSPHQVHIRIRRKKTLCRINQGPILEMDMTLVPACDGRLPGCLCRKVKTKVMPHWRKLFSAEPWTSSTREGTLPMSSGMWDG